MKKIIFLLCFVGLFLYLLTNVVHAQNQKIKCNVDDLKELTAWGVSGKSGDGETIIFNPKSMSLTQSSDKINCQKKIEEVGDKCLNAYVLKYLKDNPGMIPDEWKKYKIVFSGTIFIDSGGNKFALCLYYWNDSWDVVPAYLSEYLYPDMRLVISKDVASAKIVNPGNYPGVLILHIINIFSIILL